MSVSITFKDTNQVEITSIVHGSISEGQEGTVQTVFITHNGENPITGCKVFITGKAAYTGSATADADKAELLAWGDASTVATFGGVQFNFDAVGSFPSSAWGTVTDKSPTNGVTVRTGVGDSADNGIIIPTATGASSIGEVANGTSPNVRFQIRIKIPSSGTSSGTKEFDIGLQFIYIS